MPGPRTTRLPFVEVTAAKGRYYLYYRRGGRRLPLPGPEGNAEFHSEYDRVHAGFEGPNGNSEYGRHTIGAAIELYLGSADYAKLSANSKRNYRYYLDEVRERVGHVLVADVTDEWLDKLRDKLVGRPNYWDALLSRMRMVFDKYRKQHRAVLPDNFWRDAKRIDPGDSTQNRR